MKDKTCDDCGNALTEEEIKYPFRNDNKRPVCDECYHNYVFTCCKCQNSELNKYQDRIGGFIVFLKDAPCVASDSLPQGVYEIIHHPYYLDSMFNVDIFGSSVNLVAGDISGMYADEYGAGFLCRECSKAYKKLARVK